MRRRARSTLGSCATSGSSAITCLVEACGTVSILPQGRHRFHPALPEIQEAFERMLEVSTLDVAQTRVEVRQDAPADVARPMLEARHQVEHGPGRDRAVLL